MIWYVIAMSILEINRLLNTNWMRFKLTYVTYAELNVV